MRGQAGCHTHTTPTTLPTTRSAGRTASCSPSPATPRPRTTTCRASPRAPPTTPTTTGTDFCCLFQLRRESLVGRQSGGWQIKAAMFCMFSFRNIAHQRVRKDNLDQQTHTLPATVTKLHLSHEHDHRPNNEPQLPGLM